jgi:hypothetical protein
MVSLCSEVPWFWLPTVSVEVSCCDRGSGMGTVFLWHNGYAFLRHFHTWIWRCTVQMGGCFRIENKYHAGACPISHSKIIRKEGRKIHLQNLSALLSYTGVQLLTCCFFMGSPQQTSSPFFKCFPIAGISSGNARKNEYNCR